MKTAPVSDMQALLRELERAGRRADDGLTTDQIRDAMKWGKCKTHEAIKRLCDEGKLEVGWRDATARNGRRYPCPVYRPAKRPK